MLTRGAASFSRRASALSQQTSLSATATAAGGARAFGSTPVASDQYDLVVIGGGPGGYVGAIKAAQLGLKTACVESRGTLGGTCLNVGCIPSKALLHSSHLYEEANHDFAKHGIKISGVELDVPTMMESKAKAVSGLTGGIEYLFKKYGVDYLKGKGKITGANSVAVAGVDGSSTSVETKNIMIATGSEVTPLPPVPVDNAGGKIVDSTGALDIQSVPEKMVVIGGGVIGLEMGSVWRRLGTEVTVVEFLDRLIPGTDNEVAKKFLTICKKQGMKFKLSTKVNSAEVGANGKVQLALEDVKKGKESSLEADVCLVSIGRRPFTEGLGLEEMGIAMDRIGRIEVDDHFQVSQWLRRKNRITNPPPNS
jgi:dihydrolipoamide dehydrogenase